MSTSDHIEENRISLLDLMLRFQRFFHYLLSKWLLIGLITVVFAFLYASYHLLRKPVYVSETTFVIEAPSGGGGGQLSSLANLAGINIGSLSGSSSLFQTDNIIELYRSRNILRQTFLATFEFDGKSQRLITRFAEDKKLLKKWETELKIPGFTFEIPDSLLTVKHDSLIFEVIEKFKVRQLSVSKLDRKLAIISVKVNDKDQAFAKRFNEELVERVNDFYLQTKTLKNSQNLEILQRQADSVKLVLDMAMLRYAEISENLPNPNPLYLSSQVPIQKLQIDIQSSALLYQEIVKNLEIAKVTLRNSTPLIQIIDFPMLPLDDDRYRPVKAIVLGLFIGGILTVLGFSGFYIAVSLLEEERNQQANHQS